MRYSFSSFDKYEQCPRRFKAHYIDRTYRETPGPEADWGSAVHAMAERRMMADTDTPLGMERFVKTVDSVREQLEEFVVDTERVFYMDEYGQPAEKTEADYIAIADVIATRGDYAICLDWKTGKHPPKKLQADIYALATFANYPWIVNMEVVFVCFKLKKTFKHEYNRTDHFAKLLAGANNRKQRIEADTTFHPRLSGLCKKHCPVLNCEYNGRRTI